MKTQVVKVETQDQTAAKAFAEQVARQVGEKVIGTYVVRVTAKTVNVAVVTEVKR